MTGERAAPRSGSTFDNYEARWSRSIDPDSQAPRAIHEKFRRSDLAARIAPSAPHGSNPLGRIAHLKDEQDATLAIAQRPGAVERTLERLSCGSRLSDPVGEGVGV